MAFAFSNLKFYIHSISRRRTFQWAWNQYLISLENLGATSCKKNFGTSPFQFNKKTCGNKKKKPVSGIIDKNYTKRANLANLSGMSHPWWPIFLVWKRYLISLENIFLFVPFEPEIFSSMAFRTSNSLFFTWHFAFSILNSHFSAWHFAEGIFAFFLPPFFPFNFYPSIFRKKVLPKR